MESEQKYDHPKRKPVADRLYDAFEAIFESIYGWIRNNKKKFILFLIFEGYLHFYIVPQHLTELKAFKELIPFYSTIEAALQQKK